MENETRKINNFLMELGFTMETLEKFKIIHILQENAIDLEALQTINSKHFETLFKSLVLPIGIQILFEKRILEWQQKNSVCELKQLLIEWNLESIYDKLVDEFIDMEALRMMTARHMKQFFDIANLKIGEEIKFESKLRAWQNFEITPMLAYQPNKSQIVENENVSVSSAFSIEDDESLLFDQPSTSQGFFQHIPTNFNVPTSLNNAVCPVPFDEDNFDLERLLIESTQGRSILNLYQSENELNDGCRTVLLDQIMNYLIENEIKMTVTLAKVISEKIVEVFPTEVLSVYYMRGQGKPPSGKVYSKYFNRMRPLKLSGLKRKRNITSEPNAKNPTAPVEFIDANIKIELEPAQIQSLNAIALDNGICWTEMVEHYTATTKYRLAEIAKTESVIAIFEKWKQYLYPQGYQLIAQDFRELYPTAGSISSEWEPFAESMMKLFGVKIKDSNCKTILQALKSQENISIDGRNATIMYLLHAVLVPTQRESFQLDDNKRTYIKYSIKDSQNSCALVGSSMDEIEPHLQDKLEPHLIVIGDNILEPYEVMVYFNGKKYKMKSYIQGMEVCFKIYRLFKIEYPIASVLIWTFIQQYFFKILTPNDKQHTSIVLLMSALNKNG